MIRCVVSKEMIVNDKNATAVLALMQRGYTVRFLAPGSWEAKKSRRPRRRTRAPNITDSQMRDMLDLRKKGIAYRAIARRFGLSLSGAANAIRKRLKADKTTATQEKKK